MATRCYASPALRASERTTCTGPVCSRALRSHWAAGTLFFSGVRLDAQAPFPLGEGRRADPAWPETRNTQKPQRREERGSFQRHRNASKPAERQLRRPGGSSSERPPLKKPAPHGPCQHKGTGRGLVCRGPSHKARGQGRAAARVPGEGCLPGHLTAPHASANSILTPRIRSAPRAIIHRPNTVDPEQPTREVAGPESRRATLPGQRVASADCRAAPKRAETRPSSQDGGRDGGSRSSAAVPKSTNFGESPRPRREERGRFSPQGKQQPRLGPPVPRRRRFVLRPQRCDYLVDPASSHMLVSKIKPCMCQYRPL